MKTAGVENGRKRGTLIIPLPAGAHEDLSDRGGVAEVGHEVIIV